MGERFTRQRECSYRSIDKSLEYDRWKNNGRGPPNFGVIKTQRWAIVRLTTDDSLMLRVHGPSIAEAYSVWAICCHLLLDWAKTYGCRKMTGVTLQISELLGLKHGLSCVLRATDENFLSPI